jgi:hypothetical protein
MSWKKPRIIRGELSNCKFVAMEIESLFSVEVPVLSEKETEF